jgi:hypothetical protein
MHSNAKPSSSHSKLPMKILKPSRNENSALSWSVSEELERLEVEGSKSATPSLSILEDLRRKVESLPKTIPLAKKNHKLAAYNLPPKDLTGGTPDDELWEIWDQKLNVLLPHETENLAALVV